MALKLQKHHATYLNKHPKALSTFKDRDGLVATIATADIPNILVMLLSNVQLASYFLCLSVFALSACHSASSHPSEEDQNPSTPTPLYSNESWAEALASSDELAKHYTADAISVASDGTYQEGAAKIAAHLFKTQHTAIDTIYSIAREYAGRDSAFVYEIGGYALDNGATYRHLVIWDQQQETPRRVLDFLALADLANRPEKGVLDSFREQWIELCSAHDAYQLVAQSYTPNALYYNHRPLVIGIDSIAVEYDYMNQPTYSLKLTPLAVEMVSADLAYEIGQCSGSYSGKYILVWQKDDEGKWKILLDSNI